MRNVVKGFQVSHLALPKVHMAAINQHFNNYHAPSLHMQSPRVGKPTTAKNANRPGKNPGVKRGHEVG